MIASDPPTIPAWRAPCPADRCEPGLADVTGAPVVIERTHRHYVRVWYGPSVWDHYVQRTPEHDADGIAHWGRNWPSGEYTSDGIGSRFD